MGDDLVERVAPGGAPDEEVAGIMHELDRLQTWMVMLTCQSRGDPVPRAAMDLIQRTRCLIVDRLYSGAIRTLAESTTDD